MTNVRPEELNYDHYETEKYDLDIINSIPGHKELHDNIIAYLKGNRFSKICDLGVGTGLTSEKIMKLFPDASLTVVDFSEQMLNGARKRLGENVKYMQGDYSEIDFGKDFDLIISVIGLHHQEDSGKKKMFKKIFNSLISGGVFVFGDLMTYKDKEKAAECDKKHFEFLKQKATDEKTLQEWTHHHKELNLLAPLEDQIEWLKDAGFSNVEVKFEYLNTVLIVAVK